MPVDLPAPTWLVRLLRPARIPVPWGDMARVALAVTTPLAAAALLDHPRYGLYIAIGALGASIADRGGPPRHRLASGLAAAIFSAVGYTVGHLLSAAGIVPLLTVLVLALVSGLLSSVNAALSMGGLRLLVVASVASGLPAPVSLTRSTLLVLLGGCWAALLTAVHAVLRGYRATEQEAVSAVFERIADLLDAPGSADTEMARRQLTAALDHAYDVVINARAHTSGTSRELLRLGGVLNAAGPLIEAAVAAGAAATRTPTATVRAVRDLAALVRSGQRGPQPTDRPPTGTDPLQRAIANGWRVAAEQLTEASRDAGTASGRPNRHTVEHTPATRKLLRDADRIITGPQTWAYVGRLALCMVIAVEVRRVVPVERPYWIMLTVALVLKPDFGSVFARAVQRALGTVIGVLLGAALLAAVPRGPATLAAIAVAAALVPWGQQLNYGLLAVFVTPLIIMLIELVGAGGIGLATARLLDTVIGCGIVLVFGYLLWPGTWRLRLGDKIAASVDALADYLVVALQFGGPQPGHRRRHAYRSLSDLRTEFQRSMAEPPPVSTRAAAWWPLIVQLERTVDEITEARTVARQHAEVAPAGAPDQVDEAWKPEAHKLAGVLRGMGEALRMHREPGAEPVPVDGPLADVAAEIDTARSLAREPVR